MAEKSETEAGTNNEKAPDFAKLSMRETIRHSYKEAEKREAEDARTAKQETDKQAESGTSRQREPEDKPITKEPAEKLAEKPAIDKSAASTDTTPAKTPEVIEATTSKQEPAATTPLSAPSSWSKEKHAVWAELPPTAQEYILERERQSQDGVQKLKRDYEDIDAAVHPYKDVIKRYNQSTGQTIRQLFEWNTALAGPHKEAAFAQLAQRFNIDLSKFAPQGQPQGTPNGRALQGIPDEFRPVLEDLRTRQAQTEAALQAERESTRSREVQRAAADIQTWAKDKPHFERVRASMQHLVGTDLQAQAQGLQAPFGIVRADGSVDLDRAYGHAVALDSELSATVRQEELAAREAAIRAEAEAKTKAEADRAAKAAATERQDAERARKAGTSLRSGAATGPGGKPGAETPKGESVRDTLRRSLKEAGGR